MPDFGSTWTLVAGSLALTYLLHSTVLFLMASLAVRIPGLRHPRSRELLWTVALLGGLVTSLASTAGITGGLDHEKAVTVEVRRVEVAVSDAPDAEAHLPVALEDVRRLSWEGSRADAPPALGRLALAAPSPACRAALREPGLGGAAWLTRVRADCAGPSGLPWGVLLLAAWGLGVLLLAVREFNRHRALARLKRKLVPASPRVRAALDRVVRGLGLPFVRIMVTPDVDAPGVVDGRTIVLPPRCQDELPDAELEAVLAHEVAHLTRKDVLWQRLFRWTALLLWFQPLNRVAVRRQRETAELVCDDWALTRTRRPLELARSLSRVAEWAVPPRHPGAVPVGSQGGRLSERVRRILSARDVSVRGGRLGAALMATAMVVLLAQLPSLEVPGATRAAFFIEGEVEAVVGPAELHMSRSGATPVGDAEAVFVRVRRVEADG